MTKPASADMPQSAPALEVIAHRGLSGLAPENTVAAFEAAIRCGANRIELDVLLSRDGVLVVIHDALLDRTTDTKGPVADRTFPELRQLDAGSWFDPRFRGERIPSLDEVLALCRGRIPVNVEIKEEAIARGLEPGQEAIEWKVAEAIRRCGLIDSTVVSSFESLALERLGRIEPRIVRETLYRGQDRPPRAEDVEEARRAGSRAFNVSRNEALAHPGIVDEAHRAGLRLKVYTVDDPMELESLARAGVDGIFTNRPDVLLAVLGRL